MSRGKILIVEDDANLLAGIRDILKLEGYTVLTATNGEAGLTVLEQEEQLPDLIVSDIMMPRMDGIQFLMKVREIDRFVSIPFIYLTAKGEKSDIQRGKKLGVDDYVVKPFNADDLLVAIKSRLDRARDMQRVQDGREDELKRSILTILNHEMRTPLTFVVAYSDMLSDVANEGAQNGEMITFLNGVKNGADRLRRLIENFIMLVELQTDSAARTYAYRKRPIENMKELILVSAESAQKIPEDGEYHFNLNVPDDLPTMIGDEEFLGRAIAHLVDNAFKFSTPDDVIDISAVQEGDEIVIRVTDHGRGIPADELENVWQMFYQIDRAHYEDQGAGSGLTIVQGITELHGGTATIEHTAPDEGATFMLRLPLQ
ncbi:MAG: response regulator, partial [Chloroflexota bacterium]